MKDINVKLKELEMKIEELEAQQENIYVEIENILDSKDVRALVDQLLKDKDMITNTELEERISKNQLVMIKWIIGTGISCVATIVSLLQILL